MHNIIKAKKKLDLWESGQLSRGAREGLIEELAFEMYLE